MSKRRDDFELTPINLHNPDEYNLFQKQRVLCGWSHDSKTLEKWRIMMDKKLKNLFWIILPHGHRAGHVSLDRHDGSDPPDLRIANPDGSLRTVSTFWIEPEYRRDGLGRGVMERLEAMAVTPPHGSTNCKALAVHTFSRKYVFGGGEGFDGYFRKLGWEEVKHANEDWYIRQGYVKFAEEPRYPHTLKDGTSFTLIAVLMRKELR